MKLGKDYITEQEVEFAVKKSIKPIGGQIIDNKFDQQLREFKQDTSYKERFRRCVLDKTYGVEIFTYRPNKNSSVGLLLQDDTGKLKSTQESEKPTNIFKVIKVGSGIKDAPYKEGDLVLLPFTMVTGSVPNPRHAMYHQLDDSNMKPILDDTIPQNIPSFIATLSSNAFLPPQEYETELEDVRTFYIYEDLIIGRYDY